MTDVEIPWPLSQSQAQMALRELQEGQALSTVSCRFPRETGARKAVSTLAEAAGYPYEHKLRAARLVAAANADHDPSPMPAPDPDPVLPDPEPVRLDPRPIPKEFIVTSVAPAPAPRPVPVQPRPAAPVDRLASTFPDELVAKGQASASKRTKQLADRLSAAATALMDALRAEDRAVANAEEIARLESRIRELKGLPVVAGKVRTEPGDAGDQRGATGRGIDLADLRAWAQANNVLVRPSGRVPKAILDEYEAAKAAGWTASA